MKYVPIVPKGAEQLLELPSIRRVFCFSDILNKQDYDYRQWFSNCSKEVIMDHPIYELQPALNLMETLQVIEDIKPDITTIPDKHEDQLATGRMFVQYAPAMVQMINRLGLKTRLMGVPQGTTYDMILEQALWMAGSGLCDMLGIGIKRSMVNLHRSELVKEISAAYPSMRFHLLGARWPYIDEAKMAHNYRVESCDTAEPINAALNGFTLNEAGVEGVKRPVDFQERSGEAILRTNLVRRNIEKMQEILRG